VKTAGPDKCWTWSEIENKAAATIAKVGQPSGRKRLEINCGCNSLRDRIVRQHTWRWNCKDRSLCHRVEIIASDRTREVSLRQEHLVSYQGGKFEVGDCLVKNL